MYIYTQTTPQQYQHHTKTMPKPYRNYAKTHPKPYENYTKALQNYAETLPQSCNNFPAMASFSGQWRQELQLRGGNFESNLPTRHANLLSLLCRETLFTTLAPLTTLSPLQLCRLANFTSIAGQLSGTGPSLTLHKLRGGNSASTFPANFASSARWQTVAGTLAKDVKLSNYSIDFAV